MMEVLPQIGVDRNLVEVSIKPEIRRFDGFINYGTPITGGASTTLLTVLGPLTSGNFGRITDNAILMPVISSLRGNTTLTIADGQTVVMGGLMSHSQVKVEDRTPVLGSLPFIGRFFQTNALASTREAFVILVTVRLQDAGGEPINNR
jgi:general secretion pathway protein D